MRIDVDQGSTGAMIQDSHFRPEERHNGLINELRFRKDHTCSWIREGLSKRRRALADLSKIPLAFDRGDSRADYADPREGFLNGRLSRGETRGDIAYDCVLVPTSSGARGKDFIGNFAWGTWFAVGRVTRTSGQVEARGRGRGKERERTREAARVDKGMQK